jgi:hypothetical protein
VCSPCITIQERDTQHLLVGLGPPRSEHRQFCLADVIYCAYISFLQSYVISLCFFSLLLNVKLMRV